MIFGLFISVLALVFVIFVSEKLGWKKFYIYVFLFLLCYFFLVLLYWLFGLIVFLWYDFGVMVEYFCDSGIVFNFIENVSWSIFK